MKFIHFLLVIMIFGALLVASEQIRAEESAPPQDSAPPEENARQEDKESPILLPPASSHTISRPGITVRENYFFQLPGISLAALTPGQKKQFLERVNTEVCTCGCPDDTVARCLVNDRTCNTVKGLAQLVLIEVKAGL